jgi:hypothetical protein
MLSLRRRSIIAAACLLAGCSGLGTVGAIKAYDGPERPGEEALLNTQLREDTFSVSEGLIVSVDGTSLPKPVYGARLLSGTHWIGVLSTVRQGSVKREQYCAFELPFDTGCIYRPVFPTYPGAGLEAKPGEPWQVSTSLLMNIECADSNYATRVAVECGSRPLCRGEAGCPKPGMRCEQAPRFGFGACAAP